MHSRAAITLIVDCKCCGNNQETGQRIFSVGSAWITKCITNQRYPLTHIKGGVSVSFDTPPIELIEAILCFG